MERGRSKYINKMKRKIKGREILKSNRVFAGKLNVIICF
jgi:hypothetical protein